MTFEEILPALKDGKRVKRTTREYPIRLLYTRNGPRLEAAASNGMTWTHRLGMHDIVASDWEIIN